MSKEGPAPSQQLEDLAALTQAQVDPALHLCELPRELPRELASRIECFKPDLGHATATQGGNRQPDNDQEDRPTRHWC